MKSAGIFIIFAFLITFCTVDSSTVEDCRDAGLFAGQINLSNQNLVAETENSNKKEIDYFAHFQPKHREVLREWLKRKKYLRPAVEEIDDGMFQEENYQDKQKFRENFEENLKFLRDTVGKNGYQYYAVGDMNRDGKKDFAVLLVDSRPPKADEGTVDRFSLAIFNAPFKKGQSPNYYEEKLHGITNSYIVFDKMIKKHLFLGKFESDVYCATYYSKGKTYYFRDC